VFEKMKRFEFKRFEIGLKLDLKRKEKKRKKKEKKTNLT
jgi:hypothetical protein